MEVFEIIDNYGNDYGYIRADNERQALCKYLMEHEELEDMMLWKSRDWKQNWKLAKYDNEDNYLTARTARRF